MQTFIHGVYLPTVDFYFHLALRDILESQDIRAKKNKTMFFVWVFYGQTLKMVVFKQLVLYELIGWELE